MENASKALLFAGAVLISIVIISMLMLMFNSLTSYQSGRMENQRETEIYEFNRQYEGYNRDDVRGNDLYSLVSKVIDYNYRKSDADNATDGTDQFQAMTIKFTIDGAKLTRDTSIKPVIFTKGEYTFGGNDAKTMLRTKSNKIFSDDDTWKKINEFSSVELNSPSYDNNFKLSGEKLDRLVTGYDKIFVEDDEFNRRLNSKKDSAVQIFYNFNSAMGETFFDVKYNKKGEPYIANGITECSLSEIWKKYLSNDANKSYDIGNSEKYNIRGIVNAYYEYVQFKRAIFKCKNTKYNEGTGRIVEMEFEFTGEFN